MQICEIVSHWKSRIDNKFCIWYTILWAPVVAHHSEYCTKRKDQRQLKFPLNSLRNTGPKVPLISTWQHIQLLGNQEKLIISYWNYRLNLAIVPNQSYSHKQTYSIVDSTQAMPFVNQIIWCPYKYHITIFILRHSGSRALYKWLKIFSFKMFFLQIYQKIGYMLIH